jgi:hypothetical protein
MCVQPWIRPPLTVKMCLFAFLAGKGRTVAQSMSCRVVCCCLLEVEVRVGLARTCLSQTMSTRKQARTTALQHFFCCRGNQNYEYQETSPYNRTTALFPLSPWSWKTIRQLSGGGLLLFTVGMAPSEELFVQSGSQLIGHRCF